MISIFQRRTVIWAALSLASGAVRSVVMGCFLGSAEVTLADGSRRELRDIHEGDLVASWDEALRRPAVSAVKAVLECDRDASELVEISLPEEDFDGAPLEGLVEDVDAEDFDLAGPAEDFAGELPGAVPAVSLCLGPHRWFCAEGVRVRGETPVVVENGTQRPIAELRAGDGLPSWSRGRCVAQPAEVLGPGEWPAQELTEAEPRRLSGRRRSGRRRSSGNASAGGGTDTGLLIGLLVGIAVLFIGLGCCILYCRWRERERRKKFEEEEALSDAQPDEDKSDDEQYDQTGGKYGSGEVVVPTVFGQVVPGQLGDASGQNVANAVPQQDAADKIMDLKGLLDAGAITQEEFDQKKTELLASM